MILEKRLPLPFTSFSASHAVKSLQQSLSCRSSSLKPFGSSDFSLKSPDLTLK